MTYAHALAACSAEYRDEVREPTEQLYRCKFETNKVTYAIGGILSARLTQGEMVVKNGSPPTRKGFVAK